MLRLLLLLRYRSLQAVVHKKETWKQACNCIWRGVHIDLTVQLAGMIMHERQLCSWQRLVMHETVVQLAGLMIHQTVVHLAEIDDAWDSCTTGRDWWCMRQLCNWQRLMIHERQLCNWQRMIIHEICQNVREWLCLRNSYGTGREWLQYLGDSGAAGREWL